MKKGMLTLLSLIMTLGIVSTAQADENFRQIEGRTVVALPLTCALHFEARGGGAIAIFGFYKLNGDGAINCVDSVGHEIVLPIHISIGGAPVELNVALGYFHIAGSAVGIGVTNSPEALLGDYVVVSADAAAILGAGTEVTMAGGAGAVTFNLGLNVLTGFGAHAGINGMTISRE